MTPVESPEGVPPVKAGIPQGKQMNNKEFFCRGAHRSGHKRRRVP
jgi:hypothetical protein